MNKYKNSFMFYPEIIDDDFNEKIYLKKEFRDTEVKDKVDWLKEPKNKNEFILSPHQIFLKNFISPDTPYNGVLIFHGTGVGKTCTSLSIAEGFKKTLKNINKKILIIANNYKENFLKELYDFRKEAVKQNPEDVVQCTGKAYELGEESMHFTRDQKEKTIKKLQMSYYQPFGYRRFANYIIQRTNGWKGDEKDINDKIKRFISHEFDDRVIIIDEIQNIKTDKKDALTKNIQPILQSIIKYGKNIKLILMSATPMFDRPDEIIFYINLLLQNDGRPKIDKNDIFNSKDGTLKAGAEHKLREVFKGYVSYIRGEKPLIFPFRIYPKECIIPKIEYSIGGKKIENSKQIQFTPLMLCTMKNIQLKTYNYYLKKIKDINIKNNINNLEINNVNNIENYNENNKKSMKQLLSLTQISNITYPIINNDNNSINDIGSFSRSSIDTDFDNGSGGFYKYLQETDQKKKKIKYRYQSHAVFDRNTPNEAPFNDEKHLYKYSTKFAKILEIIKKSKGLIFIFSQYIEQGVLPLALALEQNGYSRFCHPGTDEDNLLDYNVNKMGGGGRRRPKCYLCGEDPKNNIHINEKLQDYHQFKPAKYILFFGDSKDIVKITKKELIDTFSSEKNKYGEDVKILIGTRTISEGLDFKRIRQVHILEPWYNLSRHDQIIGRAIRNYSHKNLLPEENNVELYQYASVIDNISNKLINRETVDLKNYRLAENKDVIIKNITRIMKESSIDCVLFRNSNIIDSNLKVKQVTSSGEVLNIPIKDKSFSSICDYKENCDYLCNWMPNPRIKYPINTDTYNIRFASNDIALSKKIIKNLFRENNVFHLNLIEDEVNSKIPNIDKLFIYSALEDLVDNKSEMVYDKFSRKGYIIYRGDYYVFQPFDLERDEIPMIYRVNPTEIKPEYVDLETIELDYSENNSNIIKNSVNENNLIVQTLELINKIYNLHSRIYKTNNKELGKKEYMFAVIGTIIDKLDNNERILFIKNILIKYYKKDKVECLNEVIDYLNFNNILIDYYKDIHYKNIKTQKSMFVGFIVNNEYFVIDIVNNEEDIKKINVDNINFVNCSKELINKIKSYRGLIKKNEKLKDFNIIYGTVEFDSKKKMRIFKIIDKSIEGDILTKEKKISKRSIVTGRICSTFQAPKLLEIRDKIGMYKIDSKRRIDFICEDLEIYFRYNQLLNTGNKSWFIEI
jgi:superfamily II DNA or RNA helicase